MHCKSCNYPLWNLTGRICPECGKDFKPSDFEFIPNTVKFSCPHCQQHYYGTGEKGHLSPVEFQCVNCAAPLHMDQMVLLPADGISDKQTKPIHCPWYERKKIGFFKGWLRTVGMAIRSPVTLIRSTPIEASGASAFWFAVLTLMLFTFVAGAAGSLIFIPFMLTMAGGGGRGPGMFMVMGFAITWILWTVITTIALLVWTILAHIILRLTGETKHTYSRTVQSICLGAGAMIPAAIPCLGFYLSLPGLLWWIIISVFMLKVGQGVSGFRASLAAIVPPTATIIIVVGLYMALMFSLMGRMGTWAPQGPNFQEAQDMVDAIVQYADKNGGQGPDHAIQLIADGHISPAAFVGATTPTKQDDVPIGDTTLDYFTALSLEREQQVIQDCIDALPQPTAAHRLGDFIFTHHGIDLANPPSTKLWILIAVRAHSQGNLPSGPIIVGKADGTIEFLQSIDFERSLTIQNTLRSKNNLPPIPDLSTIKDHQQPDGNP